MMFLKRWLWKAVLPGVIAALIFFWAWPPSLRVPVSLPEANRPVAASPPRSASPIAGSASCTGRGCHGNIEPTASVADTEKILRNEYSLWVRDPHAQSYRTLFNKRSERMSKLLAGAGETIPPHQDARCLACHANPELASAPIMAKDEQTFGIGCESCHGNAKKWLVSHTDRAWRTRSPQEKWDPFQMIPVTDPVRRAAMCAGCHVGAPPDPSHELPLREVNHDLIAAGHPRLNFEFGAYQSNMPAHWRAQKSSDGHRWAVGQIASAQAALDLLIHRAVAVRAKSAPWPEFAEYDCFSCHHSLSQPSWRQKDQHSGRKPGALSWGTWYFALTRQIADDAPNGSAVRVAMDQLEVIMHKPYPDRALAARSASKVRAELQESAKGLARWQDEAFARKRIFEVIMNDRLPVSNSWDGAEQVYLALHALNPSPALNDLAKERAFRPGHDGPAPAFRPRVFVEKLKAMPRN